MGCCFAPPPATHQRPLGAAVLSAKRALFLMPPPHSKADLNTVAKAAISWLLASRTADGRIPYIIHPKDNSKLNLIEIMTLMSLRV